MKNAATAMATAVTSAWRRRPIGLQPIESVLTERAADPHPPLGARERPTADGEHDDRRQDEPTVLEHWIYERRRAQGVLAEDVHRVRGRQEERERLQDARQQGDRERGAGGGREEEVRAVDEEVRVADGEDDPSEQVRDADERDGREDERGHRI